MANDSANNMTQGGINLGQSAQLTLGAGDVVGRDKIITNIQLINQRALSAIEEAKLAREFERQELAQGVSAFVSRLQARASEAAVAKTGGPYKGLLEYRLSDAELFFGRERAIRELLQNLGRGPLTVLHSESGAGKTSLLQAGLSPQLIAKGHLPVYLRPYNLNPALALKRAFLADPAQAPTLAAAPLRDFLRKVCEVLGQQTTLYVFIDQFEETFTRLEDAERGGFVNELAECLEDDGLNVRWVLALRSEYFGNLANFRPRIRNPFENDYRLNRLTRAEAQEVIAKPAEKQDFKFETGLIEALLDDLGKNEIAPPQIQLVCLSLFEELELGQILISRALYDREGGAAGILRGHLERVLSRDLRPEQRAAARRLLETLISSEAQRVVRSHRDLVAEMTAKGVTPETLDMILSQLVDSRLLRADETDDGLAYELAHDYLVGEIKLDPDVQARKAAQELLEQEVRVYRCYKTLLTEDRLKVIEPYHKELRFTPESEVLFSESQKTIRQAQAKRERQRNMLVIVSIVVAVAMTALALWGVNRSNEAQRQADLAQAANTQSASSLSAAQAANTQAAENLSAAQIANTQMAQQRDEAQRQARIALANQLATQALSRLDDQPDLALLLSVEAYNTVNNLQSRSSLLSAIEYSPRLTRFLHGHANTVLNMAFSSDGKRLVSGSRDNVIVLWDVATGQPNGQSLTRPTSFVWSMVFSPDGKTAASVSVSDDDTIILWDMVSGQPLGQPLTGHTMRVLSLAFSPDGKILASGSQDNTIILWDVATRRPLGQPLTAGTVLNVAFSHDGKTLASAASVNGTITLWDVATRQPLSRLLTADRSILWSVAFSQDDKTLASGHGNGIINLWDVATGQPIGQPLIGHSDAVRSVAFSPDGKTLASGSDDQTIILWNVSTGRRIGQPLSGHTNDVTNVVFSRDGETLASSSGRTIILWNVGTGQPFGQLLTKYKDSVLSVAFSPDSKTLAASSNDSTIILWDVRTRQPLGQPLTELTYLVEGVAFSPDGTTLASGNRDGTIILWDVKTRQLLGQPLTGHVMAFSPNGKTLASGHGDGTIILWDVATSQPLGQPLTGHTDSVESVAFSPDGKTLASGSDDDTIILWDVRTRQPLGQPLVGHRGVVTSVAFSPDGQTLASGSIDNTVILWNVATGQRLGRPLANHTDFVLSVAFSPDGKTLASGSDDKTIILWDVATGQPLGQPLTGHTFDVRSVAFSPDGKTLASGSEDRMIILWDVDPTLWQARACAKAGRNLTQAEWKQYLGDEPYHQTCDQWPEGE